MKWYVAIVFTLWVYAVYAHYYYYWFNVINVTSFSCFWYMQLMVLGVGTWSKTCFKCNHLQQLFQKSARLFHNISTYSLKYTFLAWPYWHNSLHLPNMQVMPNVACSHNWLNDRLLVIWQKQENETLPYMLNASHASLKWQLNVCIFVTEAGKVGIKYVCVSLWWLWLDFHPFIASSKKKKKNAFHTYKFALSPNISQ